MYGFISYSDNYTLQCSEKKPCHIFFHISMNDVWISTKIAVNIPKER